MFKRIIITLLFLTLYVLGKFTPVPGVNFAALKSFAPMFHMGIIENIPGRVSIFSLGIAPYVSVNIVIMLLTTMIPALNKTIKSGAAGVKKIDQHIYGWTVLLALFQSFCVALWMEEFHTNSGLHLVSNPGVVFRLTSTLSITAGTLIIIWMAQGINRYGIGNGISLVFLTGLIMELKHNILRMVKELSVLSSPKIVIGLLLLISFIGIILFLLKCGKKIPIIIGEGKLKNSTITIPFSIMGILPILFAYDIFEYPMLIAGLKGTQASSILVKIANILTHVTWISYLFWIILIIFFSYFLAAVVFNPRELASKMKKLNLFIAGTDTEKTAEKYIERLMTRNIILIWGIFLCLITFVPIFLSALLRLYIPFTGYELILFVGIILGIDGSLRIRGNLKEVFSHRDIKNILVVKTRLESEGIAVIIDNHEVYGQLLSLTVGPMSGKRLLVNEQDYDKSLGLIT